MKTTIHRSGDRPITFEGTLIAGARSPQYFKSLGDPRGRYRWFEMYVYETTGGKIVVNVLYRFTGRMFREQFADLADVVEDRDAVFDFVDLIDPFELVAGFPATDEYAAKNAHLQNSVNDDFNNLVDAIYDQLQATLEPEVIL